jgi:negative regulator of replication initiation
MADRKDFFREIAAQYRQLAEIASNPEIKQRMLDIAATYQAKADEDNTPSSSDAAARFEPR